MFNNIGSLSSRFVGHMISFQADPHFQLDPPD